MLVADEKKDLELLKKYNFEYKPNEMFNNPYYVNASGSIIFWVKDRRLEVHMINNLRNELDVVYDLIKDGFIHKQKINKSVIR